MQWSFIRLLLCSFLLIPGSASWLAAEDFSLGGYVKSYLYLFQPKSVRTSLDVDVRSPDEALFSNRFRLNASYSPRSWLRLEAAYDLAPGFRSLSGNSLLPGQIDPFVYRAVDLDPDLYPSETGEDRRFALGQNLDRASVTLRSRQADFTIGRQAISWGSARVINPTDVLAPFTFETLDTEDRIGIDAVRARIPIGLLSEIDVGYVFGEDFEFGNSAFFARTGFHAATTDFSLLVMGFRENLLIGFDMARSIGGAGFWLETAYVFSDALNGEAVVPQDNYFRASSGLDYNVTGDIYGFVEYHFNGAGTAVARDYVNRFTDTAYAEGAVYLMGRHYLIPGFIYQYNPLVSLTFQSLINMGDPSVFLAPQVEYNIAPSTYLSAGTFIGLGENPVLEEVPQSVSLSSEFGAYPNIFFTSLRYYF